MKNLKIQISFLLILVFISYGCSSVNTSASKTINVDKVDGINVEEAIFIASFYIKNDDYYQKYYSLLRPKVKDNVLRKDCWAVEFNPKITGILKALYPLQISVDKNTGEIRGGGATK